MAGTRSATGSARKRKRSASPPSGDEGAATAPPKRSRRGASPAASASASEDEAPRVPARGKMKAARRASSGSGSERDASSDAGEPMRLDGESSETEAVGGAYDDAPDEEPQMRFLAYFDAHGRTSDNRLSSLPLLDHKEYIRAIRGAPPKHEAEIRQGIQLHSKSFPEWHFQLLEGFNLCFYGFGSKQKLLNAFADAELKDYPVVTVSGFNPSVTAKSILAQIVSNVVHPMLGIVGTVPAQVNDAIAKISDHFARGEHGKLFVVIHNIDGEQLRNGQAQNALSHLASVPNVHLVCSIDHINAPLLWDASRMSKLSFLWHDVTTFEPYDVETSMAEDSGLVSLVRGDGHRSLGGMKHVMRSLPVNARKVFRVLAEHQLAASGAEGSETSSRAGRKQAKAASKAGPSAAVGLPLQIYRRKCEEQFIPGIGSDVTFRAQLREFVDHKLMEQVVTAENGEVVFIPMESKAITDLLAAMNDL